MSFHGEFDDCDHYLRAKDCERALAGLNPAALSEFVEAAVALRDTAPQWTDDWPLIERFDRAREALKE